MSALSRRAFAERLALALAAPLILSDLPALVAAAPPGRAAARRPAPLADLSPLARALTEAIRVRYGARLSSADLAAVARTVEARLQGLERLYQVPLRNADEPDFVFSVYRGDG